MSKIRLDTALVDRGFFNTREKAKIAIMEGSIFVNNQKEDKPGCMIKDDAVIEFRGEKNPYVSRGGFKLEKAINVFNIDLNNKNCMDIGSSTGGFTDCMLQNGAKLVYAVDCGTNQLAYKLRIDNRVKLFEKTNARFLTKDIITDNINFVSIDVSFISLDLILPVVYEIIDDGSYVVALIKPQFEVGKENVGDGVIRDKKLHIDVIKKIKEKSIDLGFSIIGIDYSPIKGPKGNIEYLLFLKKDDIKNCTFDDLYIENLVNESHEKL